MSTYQELLQQRADLEARIAEARKSELSNAVAQARKIVHEYDLTPQDIFGGPRQAKVKQGVTAPKYRDPQSGATWTGRGKPPRWIMGKERDQFLIA